MEINLEQIADNEYAIKYKADCVVGTSIKFALQHSSPWHKNLSNILKAHLPSAAYFIVYIFIGRILWAAENFGMSWGKDWAEWRAPLLHLQLQQLVQALVLDGFGFFFFFELFFLLFFLPQFPANCRHGLSIPSPLLLPPAWTMPTFISTTRSSELC